MKVLLRWECRRKFFREIALLVEVRDLWCGIYWDYQRRSCMRKLMIYVCVLPCLPLRIDLAWREWS